jgi:putative drug exporter of the RND superfamily
MVQSSTDSRAGTTALARGVVRWRWAVLALWVGIALVAVPRAARVEDRLDVRGGSLRVTEASRVDAILRDRFKHDIGETFVLIVTAPAPFDSAAPRQLLTSLSAALRRRSYVRQVTDSGLMSSDRRTALVLVTLNVSDPDSILKLVEATRATLRTTLGAAGAASGYKLILTGDTPLEHDMLTVTTQDVRRSEQRLLPLTGGILILALGSVVAGVLPLVIGFLSIAVALALIAALAPVIPMSIYVLEVTSMIGLGLGIDYSLLVVTRFREEMDRGLSTAEATVRTVATAGATVATSGLCVAVGFAALLLTPLIETRSIGVGGLIVVAVAVVMSLTLLPALLAVLGARVGRRRWLGGGRHFAVRAWGRWAQALARHPVRALVLGGVTVACLSAPLARLRIALPAHHWWPAATEAGEGLDVLTRLGGAGLVQPIRALIEWPVGRTAVDAGALRGLHLLADSLRADPRVREVQSLVAVRPGTSLLEYALLYSDLPAVRARYPELLDALLSSDARVARADIVLADTTSLLSAQAVVRRARRLAAQKPAPLAAANILVGGYVAQNVDLQDDLLGRFPLLAGLIFAATALMLGVVFRSVLIPLKAIVLNAVSLAATFGLIVLVFQWGLRTEAIFVVVPVLVFCVVFGLSMDYEVFLLSRIKEAFDRTGDNDDATIEGLGTTAGVITLAALLMIVVFGAFAFARVLVIQMLGFGLAAAVLLDATIIRLVLVPAVLHLAGRWNWWPGVRAVDSR